VPGYAYNEHPSNALLRSLGRDDYAQGRKFEYAVQETTPCTTCKRGEAALPTVGGYGQGYRAGGCGYGYKKPCYKPAPVAVPAYASYEHPSNALLKSLGRDDLAQGKRFEYAVVEETPCKRGAACAYDSGCDGHAYGSCKVCLDKCEPEEEIVVEKAEPRVISMWENPVWTPNVRTASGLGGYTAGVKMVPGNLGLPGAATEPVPVPAARPARTQVLKKDAASHVIDTTTDCGGCGYCDECESSGAPNDWSPRYSRPRYHDRRTRNYLW